MVLSLFGMFVADGSVWRGKPQEEEYAEKVFVESNLSSPMIWNVE